MKKRILIVTLAIMSLFAISAFAQGFGMGGGYGRGGGYGGGWGHMGGGYGPCWGGGWGGNGGYGGNGYGAGATINNESDAKAVVQDIINDNLKGYKIGDVVTVNGYNGNQMYFVYATDNSGNTFTFMTSSYGGVRGPIPGKITPPTF